MQYTISFSHIFSPMPFFKNMSIHVYLTKLESYKIHRNYTSVNPECLNLYGIQICAQNEESVTHLMNNARANVLAHIILCLCATSNCLGNPVKSAQRVKCSNIVNYENLTSRYDFLCNRLTDGGDCDTLGTLTVSYLRTNFR
jgi:hypothetical protein